MSVQGVLNVLRSRLGLPESPPGSNNNLIVEWYNKNVEKIGRGPWCEMTNTWAMWNAGGKNLKKGRAYTVYACEDAIKGVNGTRWTYGTHGMRAGDQVYYDWNGHKNDYRQVDHTGTVEKINGDGTFYVLEGNIGDKLQRVRRDSKYVVGYVRFPWPVIPPVPSPPPVPKPTPPREPNEWVKKFQGVLELARTGLWRKDTDRVAVLMRNVSRAYAGWPKNVKIRIGRADIMLAQQIVDTKVDGDFGPKSTEALVKWVKEFQSISGLTVDGEWGPQTDNFFLKTRLKFLSN